MTGVPAYHLPSLRTKHHLRSFNRAAVMTRLGGCFQFRRTELGEVDSATATLSNDVSLPAVQRCVLQP
eukprot:scaffold7987_cov200-Cylindrotheca_fusiformis.AAC.5